MLLLLVFWCVPATTVLPVLIVTIVEYVSDAIETLLGCFGLACILSCAFVHQNARLRTSLVVLDIILLTLSRAFLVLSPHCKMVENDTPGNRHVQTSCLIRVLRYVHKVVADLDLIFIQARAFIAQQEQGIP